jgi:hypothetical protein
MKAEAAEVAHLNDTSCRHSRCRRTGKGVLNENAAKVRPRAKIEAIFTIVFVPPTTLVCSCVVSGYDMARGMRVQRTYRQLFRHKP